MQVLRSAVGIAFACVCFSVAQSEVSPQFEVASVKPSPPPKNLMDGIWRMQGGPGTKDPERVTFRNYALRDLIAKAYGVDPIEIVGPAWMFGTMPLMSNSDRFDIEAKVAPGTTSDQFDLMLQNLLAQRFRLKVRRGIRYGPLYALVVGKNGPKLKESPALTPDSNPDEEAKVGPKGEDGFGVLPPSYSGQLANVTPGRVRVKFMRRSMPQFAQWLWFQLKKPVLDRTALKGIYDFYLEHRRETPGPNADDANDPDLFGAVQAQLGLKLESEHGDFEMLIVEQVDRVPTSN